MQLGLISKEEALAKGLSSQALYRRVRSGKWQELFPGIYLPSPQKPSLEQELFGGCRWADAVASGRSAARLFKLLDAEVIELTTCRNLRSPRPEVIVHRVRSMSARDFTRIGLIPVTTPIRTIFDIAGLVDEEKLRSVVYEAWQRDLIVVDRLERALAGAAHGKPGIAELRRILEEGLDSYLERMLRRLLEGSPVSNYHQEFEVIDSHRRSMFIDFAYTAEKVAVEADGWATHSDRAAFQHDRQKWRELGPIGWTVLPFTYEDIKFAPRDVIATISAALNARGSFCVPDRSEK